MKLKKEFLSLQLKFGMEAAHEALGDLYFEESTGLFHNPDICPSCWQDPVNGLVVYCPFSVHHPLHSSHHCPVDQACDC